MAEQPKIDDSIWEQKDLRSARQSSIRGSADIIAAMINVGAYKPENPEDAINETIKFAKKFVDYIYEGMNKPNIPTKEGAKIFVQITDGKETTRDNKDFLKKKGFYWNKDDHRWQGNFDINYWNNIKKDIQYKFKIVKEGSR